MTPLISYSLEHINFENYAPNQIKRIIEFLNRKVDFNNQNFHNYTKEVKLG